MIFNVLDDQVPMRGRFSTRTCDIVSQVRITGKKGSTLKNGFFEKLKKQFLGHSRRPIYTNSQTSTPIGVATLRADIPTNKQRYIERSKK